MATVLRQPHWHPHKLINTHVLQSSNYTLNRRAKCTSPQGTIKMMVWETPWHLHTAFPKGDHVQAACEHCPAF